MKRIAWGFAAALLALAATGVALADGISGVVANPGRCAGVSAIQRSVRGGRLRFTETKGEFDPRTGRFAIRGLAPGEYDLRVHLKGGGWVDGADMRMREDEQSGRPLTDEHRKMIDEVIENLPVAFMDTHRRLRIEGNGEFARVLVEQIRHRDYHSGTGGDIIWRVEVWKFEHFTGEWVRAQRGWVVLARERVSDAGRATMNHEQFRNQTWLFDPALAGFRVEKGEPVQDVQYEIPEKLDESLGKVPGSVQEQIEADRERRRKEAEHDGLE